MACKRSVDHGNGTGFCVGGCLFIIGPPRPEERVNDDKKRMLIEAIRKGLTTAQAAEKAGITTRTITRWRKVDRKFADAIDEIRNESRKRQILHVLDETNRRLDKLEEKWAEYGAIFAPKET